ncbi:hypothetical protein [Ciceribacter ferrooxidans]|uniref:Transmembrane protein n=1 Tax=Ciceribacter ferrooxidans TaxID=2509717 RepID=A0A4Q2T4R2_9HYPH|nr:hypothetical protein [Ciceribacter ferrooxidans]RYC11944.1 hypothetical protein EUU22_12815 [Ciceribacter ferrooxidans]
MLIDNKEKAARKGIRASAATVLLTAALLFAWGPGLAPSPASAAQADLAPGAATPSALRAAGATIAPEPDVSPLTTGSITAVVRPRDAGIASSVDRRVLMALMMIGFVGMASASISLWRRSIRDVVQAEQKRRGR